MEYSNDSQQEIQTPYTALLAGRDEDEQYLLASLFLSLTEDQQEILVGEGTLAIIRQWITSGLIPQTHALAISKLIGMLALENEVELSAVPQILEKLGIAATSASQVAEGIAQIVRPFLQEREENSVEELAPRAAPIPPPPPSSSAPSRNTIDLRNKPLT